MDAENRHVLVPSRQAEAEPEERVVWVSGLSRDQLSALPVYNHDPSAIDGDFERRLVSIYDRGYTEPNTASGLISLRAGERG